MPAPAQTLHAEFRRLVGPIVADRKEHFPDLTDDWLAECYASAAAFEQRFPTRDEQEAVIAGFRQVDEFLRAPLSRAALAALSAGPPPVPEETPEPRNGARQTRTGPEGRRHTSPKPRTE
jgi:hypothetical protein